METAAELFVEPDPRPGSSWLLQLVYTETGVRTHSFGRAGNTEHNPTGTSARSGTIYKSATKAETHLTTAVTHAHFYGTISTLRLCLMPYPG